SQVHRRRLHSLPPDHHPPPHSAPHGGPQNGQNRRVCQIRANQSRGNQSPLPGHAHQCHQLFPQSQDVRCPQGHGFSSPCQGPRSGSQHPHLDSRLRFRRRN